jgi:hypothetical protein
VHSRRTQTFRLGLRRLFGPWTRRTASCAAGPLGSFATFRSLGTLRTLPLVGALVPAGTLAVGALVTPAGTAVARSAISAVASAPLTVAALAAAAFDEGRGDELLLSARRADDLDALGFVALLLLDRSQSDDRHAIEIEVGVGAEDLPRLRALRYQRTVDDSSRLACARGAPRPGSVTTVAGELDIDPARHGERR